jgi:hypothetical protein
MISMKNAKTVKKENTVKKMIPDIKWAVKYDVILLTALLFIISALYFCLFAAHVFFFQENLSLFVFSGEYIRQFLLKPGGLLEYAGNFFTQGYFSTVYGALMLSILTALIAAVLLKISKKLSPGRSYSLILIFLPSCLLLLMQSNFSYLMYNNLGFLLAGLYFLFSLTSDKKPIQIGVLVFFPVFYYLVGAYAWVFLGMYIVHNLMHKRVLYPFLLLLIALFSVIFFKKVVFLQSFNSLLLHPLPLNNIFIQLLFFYLLCGFLILFPAIVKIFGLIKINIEKARIVSLSVVIIFFIITVISLSVLYKSEDRNLFQLEKLVTRQDWDGVIKYQETYQSSNLIAAYYYNLALSEKGQLCERMFFAPQTYGTRSLIIPWNSQAGINNIFRGVYFFYTVGLINEAHRWAFESMVMQGYRPENIKLLIKTDLINGHYKVAEKYLYVLKKTLHYRKWAKKYEKMLYNPALINSDPELGEKMRLQPKGDFSIRIKNPQTNIPELLRINPKNEKAFEYKMAWYLLEKNVGGIMNEIKTWKELGYKKMPRHIEEAATIFYANIGPVSEDSGLKISEETDLRFLQYGGVIKPFSGSQSPDEKEIKKKVGNTYWYYLDSK